jgi:hypothetical protein
MLFKLRRYSHYFLFIFISFMSLYIQYNAGGFKPIIFHDSPYPIDTLSLVSKFGSSWRDIANFGYFDPSGIYLTVWYIFLSPIYILTNNLVITQFVFLFIICNVTLFGSYIFARYLGISKVFSIVVAVLYLANPLSIFYIWRILNANIILYAFVPLIFLSIIKIINGENSRRYIAILLFTEFLSLPGFANLAYYVPFALVTLLLSISYSIIAYFSHKASFKRATLKNLLVIGLLVLPLSPYLMSTFQIQPKELSAVRDTHLLGAESIYLSNIRHINLSSLFSLTALPPLYENLIWFDYEYIYLPNISSAVGIAVASMIVVSLSIRVSFFKDGIKKNMYPFIGILAVLVIVLFGETGYLLLKNSPALLLAFREPYHKFQTEFTLVLIVLFCYSAQELLKLKLFHTHKPLRIIPIVIVVFIMIYWTWPFITGRFVPTNVGRPQGDLHTISALTDIPYKYMPAVKYLKQDNDIVTGKSRVLVYPLSYKALWCDGNGSYYGNDILRFSGISTVSTYHVNSQNESNFISILSDDSILSDYNYANYLKKLGIKYIVVKKQACDVDAISGTIIGMGNQSKQIEEKLNNPQFKQVMENQYYSIFLVGGGDSSSVSMITESSAESLKYLDQLAPSSSNSAYNNDPFLLIQTSSQPIKYEKISSTEYIVSVEGSYEPFYIILAQSYDDGWKASINGNEHVPDKYHFIMGSFANGWYFNKAGHFTVRLYFQPQQNQDIGLALYVLVVCITSVYLLLYPFKTCIRTRVGRLLTSRKA